MIDDISLYRVKYWGGNLSKRRFVFARSPDEAVEHVKETSDDFSSLRGGEGVTPVIEMNYDIAGYDP